MVRKSGGGVEKVKDRKEMEGGGNRGIIQAGCGGRRGRARSSAARVMAIGQVGAHTQKESS